VDREPIDASSLETLPHCRECGALMRPDIVWFGEALDPAVLNEATRLASAADVCIVIGTSAVVYPAAGLAVLTAGAGGTVIEVNVAAPPLSDLAAIALRGPAAAIVPQLLAAELSAP
jgi:NAD-dependent deacetylase